ncbi:MAG TPA: DUF177 domain-containing protein [Sphingobacteriaceae bacterium]
MKPLQQYHIPFTGLKFGKHQFDFEVDEAFFSEFEYSLVKNGALKISLEMDKQETMLILQFEISGQIFLNCDKCLADFPSDVNITERQIVKFSNDANLEDNTDEIIILNRNEHEIDVSGLIYEYINLAVPFVSRCDDEGNTPWCDNEMIRKLSDLSVKNEQEDNVDPRWEALKKIKK